VYINHPHTLFTQVYFTLFSLKYDSDARYYIYAYKVVPRSILCDTSGSYPCPLVYLNLSCPPQDGILVHESAETRMALVNLLSVCDCNAHRVRKECIEDFDWKMEGRPLGRST
jgi:hypothetical protein